MSVVTAILLFGEQARNIEISILPSTPKTQAIRAMPCSIGLQTRDQLASRSNPLTRQPHRFDPLRCVFRELVRHSPATAVTIHSYVLLRNRAPSAELPGRALSGLSALKARLGPRRACRRQTLTCPAQRRRVVEDHPTRRSIREHHSDDPLPARGPGPLDRSHAVRGDANPGD